MAKVRRKARQARTASSHEMPTPEAMRHGAYAAEARAEGARMRRIPPIDSLFRAGKLNDMEHRRLSFYRSQAEVADRSSTKSCLNVGPGSGRDGMDMTPAQISATLSVARIERDLGELRSIARAVAVDDQSLPQWCIQKFGGRERYDGKGRCVAIVPVNEKKHMDVAMIELRMAAHRIVP